MTQRPSAQGETPGQSLRRERLRQGLSPQQVAEALNLDPWAVEAIEADRFLALGAQVYAKGHLRKYALLLGLEPDPILDGYSALQSSTGAGSAGPAPAAVRLPKTAPSALTRTSVWLPFAILSAGFAVLWIWKVAVPPPDVVAIQTPSDAPPAAVLDTPTPEPADIASKTGEPAAVGDALSVPASAIRISDPATPAGPSVALTLVYSGDSWTEVYDTAGNKLMFDTGLTGQTRTLVGPAPLTVVLGAASAVAASVDGRALAIPLRSQRESAKFVVGVDGKID